MDFSLYILCFPSAVLDTIRQYGIGNNNIRHIRRKDGQILDVFGCAKRFQTVSSRMLLTFVAVLPEAGTE